MIKPIMRDIFFWDRNRNQQQRKIYKLEEICRTHYGQIESIVLEWLQI